jgi:hypothetical protein
MAPEHRGAERSAPAKNLIDVLDRVLDKGIVIDAQVRVAVAGIDLVNVEARIVVASVETYLRTSDAIANSGHVAHRLPSATIPHRPVTNAEMDRAIRENVELKRKLNDRTVR